MSFFEQHKKIFIVGIAGSGVSALAHFLHVKGCIVFGADIGSNPNLEDIMNSVVIYKEFKEDHIDNSFDLLIYSSVWNETNPERKRATELNIKQLDYFGALGEISKEFNTIAISGTNGKSTTTALTGMLLTEGGFDPNVVLGAGVNGFGFNHNFRNGNSNSFVVEACEYQSHMLLMHPKTIILTNIEAEHLDYYRDLDHIIETFKTYIKKLKTKNQKLKKGEPSLLIYNADCKNTCVVAEYAKSLGIKTPSFGIDNEADLMAKNIRIENEKQVFDLVFNRENLGEFCLNVPGKFNISNLLGGILNYLKMDIARVRHEQLNVQHVQTIQNICDNFFGIERRFEIFKKDEERNIIYVTDYAHNPYKVKATISGVKEFYKNRRVVSIFQPHTYDRTKKLFNEFVESFKDSDLNIFAEIYEPANRDLNSDKSVSSNDLKREVQNKFKTKSLFAKNLQETIQLIKDNIQENDIVLIMGAGDINKICGEL